MSETQEQDPPRSALISIGEAMAILGVTRPTVHRWIKKGLLTATPNSSPRPPGRGRPCVWLVDLGQVTALAQVRSDGDSRAGPMPDAQPPDAHAADAADEVAQLRAQVARVTELVRLGLAREAELDEAAEHDRLAAAARSRAEMLRREQLLQFVAPDFVDG